MKTEEDKADTWSKWVVPLVLIAFAAAAIYISTTFKKMPPILKRGIQPSDFPQLIAGLIVFLTLLMAWFDPPRRTERVATRTWATMALIGAFVVLMQVDLFLALGAFAAGLAALWGERRVHMLGLVGLVMPAAIFFLFDLAFRVRFPRGLLTNLWYG